MMTVHLLNIPLSINILNEDRHIHLFYYSFFCYQKYKSLAMAACCTYVGVIVSANRTENRWLESRQVVRLLGLCRY
jgi:hypothetical protein